MTKTKKLMIFSLLLALAVVLYILEGFLPNPVPVPGIKLGLANIIILLSFFLFDFREILFLVMARVLLASLLSGSLLGIGFMMSLSGAIVSAVCMYAVYHSKAGFSLIGVSVLGATVHNITQLLVFYFIVGTIGIFSYLPFLVLSGIGVGIMTGYVTLLLENRIKDFLRNVA
jgi:heptaprenyl diphosphate synthase